ncbi:serine hydrolase [Niastella populi]|uniref:beta-lactamase n=1 Tax=Niastella populi TaxID=550983 RepID=A0A1V9FTJ5_9BACT|nr:serine hydrolase [Niastella populi]OQP61674.1 serine hydrolase [Niastella populi]
MKIYTLILFLIFTACSVSAQKTDHRLQQQIEALVKDLHGDIGVYIKNLRTGKVAMVNADSIFPTASMVKVPILIGIQDKMESGQLEYHQQLEYKDSLLYAGEDILGSFKSGEKIGLHKVLMLMLTTSDNTASLWLQSLAGTGTRINELLDSAGMKFTRVNSRTPGREANRQQYGWGQTTPREMGTLMEKIYRGEIISKKAGEKMIRLLGRNFNDEQAIAEIPPYIFVASKNGCVNASRSEILLVMAPGGPYIFSVQTKNLQDQSWDNSNEAWVLTRRLSALCWNYFEPRSRWKPSL